MNTLTIISPVTPERAQVHAVINALTVPAVGYVPLRETCEHLAEYDAHLLQRIEQITAERDELSAALAGIPDPAAFVQAARGMEAMLMEAIERVEAGDLYRRMCCDGHMCGCQGSTNADQFLHYANEKLTAFRAATGEA